MEEHEPITERIFSRKLNRSTYSPVVSLGLLVLSMAGLVGYLLYTMSWVDHTNQVIQRALYSEKLLLDLQSATRGFYLTGNVSMLSRYRDTRDDLPEALRTLRELVNDNPVQSARVDALTGDVHTWLTWVDHTVKTSAPREGLRPATTEVVAGKNSFDHIVADLSVITGEEYALRDQRSLKATRAAHWSLAITALLTALVAAVQCTALRRQLGAITLTYRSALRQAKERRERVEELLRELDHELKAVGEIQRSLLPIELPAVHGLDIAASYQASQRAGGDYYDFFLLPPTRANDHRRRFGILIADVSGHGTPAAVLMAVTHSIAHGFEQPDRPPADLLAFVNRRLCDGYTTNNTAFVTAFYAIYDSATRQLTYSSAGHNPPRLRLNGADTFTALDQAQALPLGVMRDEEYISATIHLALGDTVVLYTDGITETRDASGEFLNVEGLDAAVQSGPPDANSMMLAVVEKVHSLAGDKVTDDRTLLIIRAIDADFQDVDEPRKQTLIVDSLDADPAESARNPAASLAEQ